jgi:hypothetical protein
MNRNFPYTNPQKVDEIDTNKLFLETGISIWKTDISITINNSAAKLFYAFIVITVSTSPYFSLGRICKEGCLGYARQFKLYKRGGP